MILLFMSASCTARPLTGYWEGYIEHLQKQWFIALEFEQGKGIEIKAFVDFIEIGGYRRLFTFTQTNNSLHLERQQPNGRPPLIFNGRLSGDSITGSFDGIGIKAARFTVKPAVKPLFETKEVVFSNGDVRLSGTLLSPVGKSTYPAVVFTHGSGAETRTPYYGMAMRFIQKGVAALVYDKRGTGQSTGSYEEAGFTELAQDALAGVALLKKEKQINPQQIGVFGHSQGGWIAPLASVLSADVAFIITSAASAVSAVEQSVYHRMNVMRQEGFDETVIKKAAGIRQRLNAATKLCYTDSVQAIEIMQKSVKEIAAVKSEPWFAASALPENLDPGCPTISQMELLFREPSEIWEKVKVPVYAVWGKKDIVVPVEKISVITDALKRAGNNRIFTKVIPDTDHTFLITKENDEWDFPRDSPGYFTDMADWVNHIFNNR